MHSVDKMIMKYTFFFCERFVVNESVYVVFFLLVDSPGVWILCADVSEHPDCSIFIGGMGRKNNRIGLLGYLYRKGLGLKIANRKQGRRGGGVS